MNNKLTIVAFGDSITAADEVREAARWPARLQSALEERYPQRGITVINAGVGGNTTREGLTRIESDVLRHRPDIVLVEFGNDVTHEPARHVDYEEFSANLETIRARVAAHEGSMILLTFPPVVDAWHAYYKNAYYEATGGLDGSQEKYRSLTRQFAKAHTMPLVEVAKGLRAAMKKDGAGEYILPDGVHLTAAGNRMIADLALPVIVKVVDELEG